MSAEVAATYISVHEGNLRAAERAICLGIEYAEMAENEIVQEEIPVRFMRVVKADIEEMKEARASLNGAIERTLL
ncbi:MAG: hypothetical protein ACOYMV_14300 [Verrucomicrobiia bacterium]